MYIAVVFISTCIFLFGNLFIKGMMSRDSLESTARVEKIQGMTKKSGNRTRFQLETTYLEVEGETHAQIGDCVEINEVEAHEKRFAFVSCRDRYGK